MDDGYILYKPLFIIILRNRQDLHILRNFH
jgi:hypothetical protein